MRSNRPISVLVVDDEPLILLDAVETIRESGYNVLSAANADKAIVVLESRNDIRILVSDVNMPGSMDGIKLAHAVRGRWPTIEIIVVSALPLPAGRNLPSAGGSSSSRSLPRSSSRRFTSSRHNPA